MNDYNIIRTFKINDKNVRAVFKDNESPALFYLKDILRVLQNDIKRIEITYQAAKVPEEHRNKVFFDHNEHWVVDLEGIKAVFKDQADEDTVNQLIDQIQQQIDHEMKSMPSPVKSTMCEESLAPVSVVKFANTKIRYMSVGDTVVCLIQDLKRMYNNEIVEEALKAVKEYEIKQYSTSLGVQEWITTDGLMDLLCFVDQEKAFNDYEEIIKLIVSNEKIAGTWDMDAIIPTKIIDGDKTDPSRYQKFMVNDISCVAYNTGNEVLIMYNIQDVCRQQGLSIEKGKMAAVKHCTFIFFNKQIFVTLHGINQILKHMNRKNFNYIKELAKKGKAITDKITWNIKGKEVAAMRHELDIREIDTMEPVEVKGTSFKIFKAERLKTKDGKHFWTLLAKDKNDLESLTFPLFVSSDLEKIFNISRARTFAKSIKEEYKGYVNIRGLRKPNALVLTISGLKELARLVSADQSLAQELIDAAHKWIENSKEDIKLALLMEGTTTKGKETERKEKTVKEEEQKEVKEQQEVKKEVKEQEEVKVLKETKGAALHSFTIDYKGDKIAVVIAVTDNHIIPYFEKDSLKKIAKLKDFSESIIDGKVYVSLQDLSSATDTKTAEEIFKLVQPEYQKFTTEITTVKKREQRDVLYDYLGSQNTELFILGAIMLAERLRSVTLWIKMNSKQKRIPGPSANNLLNDLWKHIYCQDHKAPISFSFRKTVTAATARYEQMAEISRFLRKED